jgi:hypothetical protein
VAPVAGIVGAGPGMFGMPPDADSVGPLGIPVDMPGIEVMGSLLGSGIDGPVPGIGLLCSIDVLPVGSALLVSSDPASFVSPPQEDSAAATNSKETASGCANVAPRRETQPKTQREAMTAHHGIPRRQWSAKPYMTEKSSRKRGAGCDGESRRRRAA